MLTGIVRNNLGSFAPLLTPEVRQRVGADDVFAFGIIDDGDKAGCGAVAFTFDGYTCDILSLYVGEDYRRKGYGTALLDKVDEVGKELNGGDMVIAYTLPDEDADTMSGFLSARGFEPLHTPTPTYTATAGALRVGKFGAAPFSPTPQVVAMSALPQITLNTFNRAALRNPDFIFDAIYPSNTDLEVSAAVLDGPEMKGGVWFSRTEDGYLLEGLYLAGDGSRLLMPALRLALEAIAKRGDDDAVVSFAAVTPAAGKLVKKLFSDVAFTAGTVHCMTRDLSYPVFSLENASAG